MENVKWCKAGVDLLKLNVYASFHIEEGLGSTGAVIRDNHGNLVAKLLHTRCSLGDLCTTK